VAAEDAARVVTVHYRNWRGHERTRKVRPLSLRYGQTAWHPTDQWLLVAVDEEDGQTKEFALQDCDFLQRTTPGLQSARRKSKIGP
jgi:predicted DNA-binding transcriptional regulator YafY